MYLLLCKIKLHCICENIQCCRVVDQIHMYKSCWTNPIRYTHNLSFCFLGLRTWSSQVFSTAFPSNFSSWSGSIIPRKLSSRPLSPVYESSFIDVKGHIPRLKVTWDQIERWAEMWKWSHLKSWSPIGTKLGLLIKHGTLCMLMQSKVIPRPNVISGQIECRIHLIWKVEVWLKPNLVYQ